LKRKQAFALFSTAVRHHGITDYIMRVSKVGSKKFIGLGSHLIESYAIVR
jgi:hypothetical protein